MEGSGHLFALVSVSKLHRFTLLPRVLQKGRPDKRGGIVLVGTILAVARFTGSAHRGKGVFYDI